MSTIGTPADLYAQMRAVIEGGRVSRHLLLVNPGEFAPGELAELAVLTGAIGLPLSASPPGFTPAGAVTIVDLDLVERIVGPVVLVDAVTLDPTDVCVDCGETCDHVVLRFADPSGEIAVEVVVSAEPEDAQPHDARPDDCWRCDAARSTSTLGLCETCTSDLQNPRPDQEATP